MWSGVCIFVLSYVGMCCVRLHWLAYLLQNTLSTNPVQPGDLPTPLVHLLWTPSASLLRVRMFVHNDALSIYKGVDSSWARVQATRASRDPMALLPEACHPLQAP